MSLTDQYLKQQRKQARLAEEQRLAQVRAQKQAELAAMSDEERDAYFQKQSKIMGAAYSLFATGAFN